MSDVIDSVLNESKEESEEPKEKTEKKHRKDKKSKKDEEWKWMIYFFLNLLFWKY